MLINQLLYAGFRAKVSGVTDVRKYKNIYFH